MNLFRTLHVQLASRKFLLLDALVTLDSTIITLKSLRLFLLIIWLFAGHLKALEFFPLPHRGTLIEFKSFKAR